MRCCIASPLLRSFITVVAIINNSVAYIHCAGENIPLYLGVLEAYQELHDREYQSVSPGRARVEKTSGNVIEWRDRTISFWTLTHFAAVAFHADTRHNIAKQGRRGGGICYHGRRCMDYSPTAKPMQARRSRPSIWRLAELKISTLCYYHLLCRRKTETTVMS